METCLKAQKEGKVRFLGFSAHSDAAALRAMELFDFDTILMPFNFVCMHHGHFGTASMEKAKEKGMGLLALKALALKPVPAGEKKPYEKMWYVPIEDDDLASRSLRYTLSLGTTAAIPPGDSRFWEKAIAIAQNGIDISTDETEALIAESADIPPLFATA